MLQNFNGTPEEESSGPLGLTPEQENTFNVVCHAISSSPKWRAIEDSVVNRWKEKKYPEFEGLKDWQLALVFNLIFQGELRDSARAELLPLDDHPPLELWEALAVIYGERALEYDFADRAQVLTNMRAMINQHGESRARAEVPGW